MVATIFFLVVSMTIIFGLVAPILRQQKIASQLMTTRESYFLAEAGVEDVVYRLMTGVTVGDVETLTLNGNTVTTVTTDTEDGKEIVSTGDVLDVVRKVRAGILLGTGVAFHYGVQVGAGGFVLANNAGVNGNIYSNGSVTGSNGAFVSDSVTAVGTINRVIIGTGTTGDAHAPTVTNSTVRGTLYCQTGSSNNKSCNTSQPNPEFQPYPVTEEEIQNWRDEALAGGILVGDQVLDDTAGTIGPIKIEGNLRVLNKAELTLTGTIWVTGDITMDNNSTIVLDSDYGNSDGVIVVDGVTTLSNGSDFSGSGVEGSYMMLLSTSESTTAVSLGNNAGSVLIYAPYGTVYLANNASVQQITAETISLGPNAVIDYSQGVINANFSSGPSGGYEILDWKEVE